MPLIGLGEIAALTTSASWAVSCQLHTAAGRMVGAVPLVTARLPLFLTATGMVVLVSGTGTAVTFEALVCILISGTLGVGISDPFLYSSSVTIGPRLATLLQSLSACITAFFATLFLGESINLVGWLGIFVATSGVAYVLIEGGIHHGADFSGLSNTQILAGICKGLMSAVCLASSLLFLKQGLLFGVEPFWAAFLRFCAGGCFVWLLALARGQFFRVMHGVWTSWPVVRLLLFACMVSTVGNCLSPISLKYTEAGIAATLIGLQPIMIVILMSIVERKLPSGHAVIGTCVAFAGTAMIFLR